MYAEKLVNGHIFVKNNTNRYWDIDSHERRRVEQALIVLNFDI
jgi:hypothetical protein